MSILYYILKGGEYTTKKVYLAFTDDDEMYEWLVAQRDINQNGIKVKISISEVIKGCIRSVMDGSE